MILLLGASGMLGHNVLKLLLKQGHDVKCIIREGATIDPEVLACASPGQLKLVRGSILDKQLLMDNLWGCYTVINCAGITDMRLGSLDEYRPVNTDFPVGLARMHWETGGRSLITVSTANTVDPGNEDSPSDENTAFGGPFSASWYARSKWEGEKALLSFAESHQRLRIAIILPGFIIGPYDRKPSSGKLLMAAYRKPLMAAPPGGKSFVDARDVAAAIVGAINNPDARGRYLATGTSMSLKDFYALQARVCGYKQVFVPLPRELCRMAGRLGDKLEQKGRSTMVVTRNVKQLMVGEWYDDSRARAELGMPRTPLEQSIKDFFAYVRK